MLDLVMVLHNHQPLGNFDWVFEKGLDKCYGPIVDLLEKHPGVRLGLHTSGPLLEWLDANRPEFLDRVAALVARGQVEPLSGGFYEPLLATIPLADAQGQVELMNRFLARRLGAEPRGFWLAERIWDPGLPLALAQSGLKYTVVDDTHLFYAGVDPDQVYAPYLTERHGKDLTLLATPMEMRYLIPFKPVEEVIARLRQMHESGVRLAVYGDDGEKFGMWPGTHEWVIEKGWLDNFMTAIEENSSWLRAATPGEHLDGNLPAGRVYLPPASYQEMTEWALPAAKSQELTDIVHTLQKEGRWETWRPFVRGGVWDNFLVKYQETNRMHKKALLASRLAPAEGPARDLVWRAQCNCAYWHGVFGGLYLGHLRRAVHQNLVKSLALSLAEQHPQGLCLVEDLDKDGRDEAAIFSSRIGAMISPAAGGSVYDLSHLGLAYNWCDTLTRRREAYHKELEQLAAGQLHQGHDGQVASIHDQVRMKEEGLEKRLIFDPCPRACLQDRFLSPRTDPADMAAGRLGAAWAADPYTLERAPGDGRPGPVVMSRVGQALGCELKLRKTLAIAGENRLTVEYMIECKGEKPLAALFSTEFNLTLYSDLDPERFLLFDGERRAGAESEGLENAHRVELVNRPDNAVAAIHLPDQTQVWFHPVYTVSMSEDGFERTYQGTALMLVFPISLAPGESRRVFLEVELRPFEG